jgi:hypothetical protein
MRILQSIENMTVGRRRRLSVSRGMKIEDKNARSGTPGVAQTGSK